MKWVKPDQTIIPLNSQRRSWLLQASSAALSLATAAPAGAAEMLKGFFMFKQETPETAVMEWEISFCKYGIDIDRAANSRLETLWADNWLKDAQGEDVARFFSGFGAGWGAGSSDMGGTNPKGGRLPKTIHLSYYDYQEDRFYRLDAELPLRRIYELFFKQPKVVIKNISYGSVVPRFSELRFGIAPQGYIMLWASGYTHQVELQTFRAQVIRDIDVRQYNARLPGGTFTLNEDRWKELKAWRFKPETIERIKAGWQANPDWYMRSIRVKFPWRHTLAGNVSRLIELDSYQGNGEFETIAAWELSVYQQVAAMRGIPETAKLWFEDKAGQRHYLWLEFYLRQRTGAESDLHEVRAAFDQLYPGRQLEDNAYLPGDDDMSAVEVTVGDDPNQITAALVKGTHRIPLPVGRVQRFALKPGAHWNGQASPKPEIVRLFQTGPGKD
ncbi:DUF2931 family protein [Undibacterium curvum]|uniref:DUF2931 family protein n=1 Tax=Undibacterium curvum TaxID=2762294 RepID=A0ABR7A9A3_9BURK|nr:DUF2931 family protein [Undibacterium curvum]MBC3933503.1 DUF2931 family protein [Undibacterium curvum]